MMKKTKLWRTLCPNTKKFVQITNIWNNNCQYEGTTKGKMVIGGSDAGGEDDATANTVTVDGQ